MIPLIYLSPTSFQVKLRLHIEKLMELGYTTDINGEELVNDDQIVEIKIQDVVISENCAEYLIKVAILSKYF